MAKWFSSLITGLILIITITISWDTSYATAPDHDITTITQVIIDHDITFKPDVAIMVTERWDEMTPAAVPYAHIPTAVGVVTPVPARCNSPPWMPY